MQAMWVTGEREVERVTLPVGELQILDYRRSFSIGSELPAAFEPAFCESNGKRMIRTVYQKPGSSVGKGNLAQLDAVL